MRELQRKRVRFTTKTRPLAVFGDPTRINATRKTKTARATSAGVVLMAKQNTFLCGCGRVIGRMLASKSWLPWNQEKALPIHRGLMCGSCGQNYMWLKPKTGTFVDVKACCRDFECGCWK